MNISQTTKPTSNWPYNFQVLSLAKLAFPRLKTKEFDQVEPQKVSEFEKQGEVAKYYKTL